MAGWAGTAPSGVCPPLPLETSMVQPWFFCRYSLGCPLRVSSRKLRNAEARGIGMV